MHSLVTHTACYGVALLAQSLLMHEYMTRSILLLNSGSSDLAASIFFYQPLQASYPYFLPLLFG